LISSDINSKYRYEASFGLANLAFYQKDYELALENFSTVIEESSNKKLKAEAQLKRAECFIQLGEYVRASEEYINVRDYNPDSAIMFESEFGYGVSIEHTGDYDRAINIFALPTRHVERIESSNARRKHRTSYIELRMERMR